MYFIGIDLGTSAVKLILIDESGEVKRIVSKTYPIYFPKPGFSEQNPQDWYDQTISGLRELLGKDSGHSNNCISPSEIGGISFSGQMHGLVALDRNDSVIRPAILWNDGRTKKETDYLNNVIGKDKLIKYTSNIAFAGFTAPKLLWMKENEPLLFSRICKIMLPKDYLLYRFTGIHATDFSDASGTLLLDVPRKKWSDPMMHICQIHEDMMPALYESSAVVGGLNKEIADLCGILPGTPVIAGAADNAAAAVGTGTVGKGRCNFSLGTSGTVFISGDGFASGENIPIHHFAHADGGYCLLGCMLSAASCYQWWCEDILKTEDLNKEQADIMIMQTGSSHGCFTDISSKSTPGTAEKYVGAGAGTSENIVSGVLGNNSVFFLPYLMGERSPHNDPNVRGLFMGLSRDTTRSEMTQAVLEGVAFGIKDNLEAARALGANVQTATICGGGAKSSLWKRICANVLDLPLQTVRNEEGPGYGAAILAATGAGAFDNVHDAAVSLTEITGTVHPDPETALKYREKYKIYRAIYPAIKNIAL